MCTLPPFSDVLRAIRSLFPPAAFFSMLDHCFSDRHQVSAALSSCLQDVYCFLCRLINYDIPRASFNSLHSKVPYDLQESLQLSKSCSPSSNLLCLCDQSIAFFGVRRRDVEHDQRYICCCGARCFGGWNFGPNSDYPIVRVHVDQNIVNRKRVL